ncbi:hypothetical protein E2320_001376 [Naja naja]|nr:hypothetical protein E2320_001376 [Naja naja]
MQIIVHINRDGDRTCHLSWSCKELTCGSEQIHVHLFPLWSQLRHRREGDKNVWAGIMLLLMLLFFWLLSPTSAKTLQTVCVLRNYFQLQESYYRPGDLVIGGNLPLGTIVLSNLGVGFEFSPGERRVYPSFFRINPKEFHQYVGLVQLLLYFQWNWVGLMAPEDERGERFISTLLPMFKEKEICLAFTERFKLDDTRITMKNYFTFSKRGLKLKCSFCSETPTALPIVVESEDILQFIKPFHGVLHFRDHTGDVSEFSHFLLSLDPLSPKGCLSPSMWRKSPWHC